MKHTPTPCSVGRYRENEIEIACEAGVFARVSSSDEEAQRTAAFIVRACNCFDELLAACKRASMTFHATSQVPATCKAMDDLLAAIAKAEAQP